MGEVIVGILIIVTAISLFLLNEEMREIKRYDKTKRRKTKW